MDACLRAAGRALWVDRARVYSHQTFAQVLADARLQVGGGSLGLDRTKLNILAEPERAKVYCSWAPAFLRETGIHIVVHAIKADLNDGGSIDELFSAQKECLCVPLRAQHSGNYIDATTVPTLPKTFGWHGSFERAIAEALYGGMDIYDVRSSTIVPNTYFNDFGVAPADLLENLSP